MAYANRKSFLFGTQKYMQMIEAPLQGADSSPVAWAESGTLMNGGGYGRHSFGSHKTYTYEWRGTSAPAAAQTLKSYQDGTYGRGPIYFLDPTTYTKNLLPARWADPSMALDYNGLPLIYGSEPEAVATPSFEVNGYPVRSALYDVTDAPAEYTPGMPDSVFVPVPPSLDRSTYYNYLVLGVAYTSTGGGGVYGTSVDADDAPTVWGTRRADELSTADPQLVSAYVAQENFGVGVRIWLGNDSPGTPASVTISGMTLRVMRTNQSISSVGRGPWVGGMGHSGCRFTGAPTWVTNNAVMNGGHIGFAASFTEVGDWATG